MLLVMVVTAATVSGRLMMVEAPSASTDINYRLSASSAAAYSTTALYLARDTLVAMDAGASELAVVPARRAAADS